MRRVCVFASCSRLCRSERHGYGCVFIPARKIHFHPPAHVKGVKVPKEDGDEDRGDEHPGDAARPKDLSVGGGGAGVEGSRVGLAAFQGLRRLVGGCVPGLPSQAFDAAALECRLRGPPCQAPPQQHRPLLRMPAKQGLRLDPQLGGRPIRDRSPSKNSTSAREPHQHDKQEEKAHSNGEGYASAAAGRGASAGGAGRRRRQLGRGGERVWGAPCSTDSACPQSSGHESARVEQDASTPSSGGR